MKLEYIFLWDLLFSYPSETRVYSGFILEFDVEYNEIT